MLCVLHGHCCCSPPEWSQSKRGSHAGVVTKNWRSSSCGKGCRSLRRERVARASEAGISSAAGDGHPPSRGGNAGGRCGRLWCRAAIERGRCRSRKPLANGSAETVPHGRRGVDFETSLPRAGLQSLPEVPFATRDLAGALRRSEDLFRSAFECTNVAMVLTDVDNRFVRVNAAFARLFGYSEDDVLRKTMADVTHPDDLAASLEHRQDLLAGRAEFFQMEKRYVHKDGHVFWGLTNVSLVRDAGGRPLQYVGQVQDITERKRIEAEKQRLVEEALRHSEERFHLLVDSVEDYS